MTKQAQEAPSQAPPATISPDSQLRPSPTEEAILEALYAIQSSQEAQDEKQEEILGRIEDLQIKLEDIEANMVYPSYSPPNE